MKEEKTGYWLQCDCGYDGAKYSQVTGCNSAAAYIWDRVRVNWDQALLLMRCPECKQPSLRITYAFPRKDREVVQVIHIVGLHLDGDYTTMMWESRPLSNPRLQWFHFNYLGRRNPFSLNRAAVLSHDQLRGLFALYENRTGTRIESERARGQQ
jgi:hypothetical protein